MAQKPLVLTVLGGGSYFTPSFIGTMVQRPHIWTGCEVRLNDLDTERVGLVKEFCEKYTERKKVPMTFIPQPDLDASLDGADFVITTFRIGGMRALTLDETIPPRFGYYGDETAGPGGMFMAIRTVPVVMDIAQRMERLCPDAWMLNYANPTHYVTAGVARTTKIKSLGLCDNYVSPMGDIGVLLGIKDHRSIKVRHAGYNHCNWVYSAEYQGRDLLQELRDTSDEELYKSMENISERWQRGMKMALPLLRLTGWLSVGTGHAMPYFYHREYLERQLASGTHGHARVPEVTKKKWDGLKAQLKEYKDEEADQVARTQHGGAHADLALGVASSLAGDTESYYSVNMPNGTAVPGFAQKNVMEFYARIGKGKAEPVPDIPQFPSLLYAQQQMLYQYKELVMEGILEKDKKKLEGALLIHPFTQSAAKARELFAAMWEEEKDVHGAYWN